MGIKQIVHGKDPWKFRNRIFYQYFFFFYKLYRIINGLSNITTIKSTGLTNINYFQLFFALQWILLWIMLQSNRNHWMKILLAIHTILVKSKKLKLLPLKHYNMAISMLHRLVKYLWKVLLFVICSKFRIQILWCALRLSLF